MQNINFMKFYKNKSENRHISVYNRILYLNSKFKGIKITAYF